MGWGLSTGNAGMPGSQTMPPKKRTGPGWCLFGLGDFYFTGTGVVRLPSCKVSVCQVLIDIDEGGLELLALLP